MNTWPIGLSTGCFYDCPIFDVLAPIREAGFELIEVCSFPKHLNYHSPPDVARAGESIRSLGLRPVSFHAPFAGHIDITSLDQSIRAKAVQELLRACEAAAALGCENIVLHPGPEREGRPPEGEFLQHMHHASESLNLVAARCAALGVRLLLENMLPHLMFGHVRDTLYLLGEVSALDVGACLDTGHAHLAGEMGVVIQKLSGHLKLVHVNDNRGDWDSHLAPGEGGIDWPFVMGELHRNAFDGILILELGRRPGEPIESALIHAARAREFVGRLTA